MAEIAIAVKVYGGDERNARLALARKSANIISLGNKPRDLSADSISGAVSRALITTASQFL